ncbi:MAG: NUDIX domain-containing protein [Cohnella sp.]|nr:NUDIX domain-containing protein [Cohnella sp.]
MGETFDVYDEQNRWVGTAAREDVHAHGYWHRTFHCWLARAGENGEAMVLFQQRSAGKDTNPGCFDITVAGHLAAGESPKDAVRELAEEIGLEVGFEQLTYLVTIKEDSQGVYHGKRIIDREVSDVYGYMADWELARFRLQEEEVAALYEAPARDLIALMEGTIDELRAEGVISREGVLSPNATTVTKAAFVPRDYGYYIDVFKRLRELT